MNDKAPPNLPNELWIWDDEEVGICGIDASIRDRRADGGTLYRLVTQPSAERKAEIEEAISHLWNSVVMKAGELGIDPQVLLDAALEIANPAPRDGEVVKLLTEAQTILCDEDNDGDSELCDVAPLALDKIQEAINLLKRGDR